MKTVVLALLVSLLLGRLPADAQVWDPNLADGMYRNPIIFADYSDPDVIRVGDDFYMTASSFNVTPALPILHSRDLVNWTLINHAVKRFENPAFDVPQHGNGVWAPSMRYHEGEFWIFWGDPDRGIYMVKTREPRGDWDPPVLIKEAYGWIDPSPLWDDDGNAYLVFAFARSRAEFNSVLYMARMSPDGTQVLDDGVMVFDGREHQPTIEGPKFYKRNGYYYIFAPAGGVRPGWQTVLRSRNIFGPYDDRIVLAQGNTPINGPHQGGWIELENGEHWFIHFQSREPYGRITHLQPMTWVDDWPVMGIDRSGDGTGEPVLEYRRPRVSGGSTPVSPQTTDDFDTGRLGLQWQWHANARDSWFTMNSRRGSLRLYSQKMPVGAVNLWSVPSLLLQKLSAPEFQATTRISLDGRAAGERAGLVMMGYDHATLALERTADGVRIVQATALRANQGGVEEAVEAIPMRGRSAYLRITMRADAVCEFSYSLDGRVFTPIGEPFRAQEGRWIGAKIGLFAVAPEAARRTGSADFDFFRIEPVATSAHVSGASAVPSKPITSVRGHGPAGRTEDSCDT
jgi:beta-xylosidase